MRALHRISQFARALRRRVEPADLAVAEALLTPQQYALFALLAPADQRHALDVCRRLSTTGVRDREVLQAALLHDLGKARSGLVLWQRIAAVLLEACAPALLRTLGARGPWRRAFGAYLRHPERGARLAARAGASPRVVALIAAHQRGALADPGLQLIRHADNA